MYINVDLDMRDILSELSTTDKEELLELLGQEMPGELGIDVSLLQQYLDYLEFRLNIDPLEYTAKEIIEKIRHTPSWSDD